jgi:hypothetical protein
VEEEAVQRGDLVRPKKISGTVFGHDGHTLVFTDAQLDRLETLIRAENYTLGSKNRLYLGFKEVAIVLQVRTLLKRGETWRVFVKIVASNGLVGWVSKDQLVLVVNP